MKTCIIIPTRGINKSMSRLREDLSDDKVNKLVKKLLLKTLESIKECEFDTFILTSEEEIQDSIGDFNAQIRVDTGEDLNLALNNFVSKSDYERYFLIMPDLPGISEEAIGKVLHLMKLHPFVICNTQDYGTACCALPGKYFQQELFGVESAKKILSQGENNKLPLSQIEISELSVDLDTIDDYYHWEVELESV